MKEIRTPLCNRCHGRGYTRKEAPIVKDNGPKAKNRYVTTALGSGCTKCLGTGKDLA
jgi:DnaJ-class molecular chaperone